MRRDVRLFLLLALSVWIAVADSAIYCFPFLVDSLKQKKANGGLFEFSINEINTISTVGIVCSYFAIPCGQLYDRKGPRATLLAGTFVNLLGWLLLFLAFKGLISTSLLSVSICYGISQMAAPFLETGSVLACLDAFSQHQGRIIMIQKTFMGLGSSVIAIVYNGFFVSQHIGIEYFFLAMCIFCVFFGLVGAWWIRLPQTYPELLRVSGLNCVVSLSHPKPSTLADGENAKLYDPAFRVGTVVLFLNLIFIFAVEVVSISFHEASIPVQAPMWFAVVSLVLVASFLCMLPVLPKTQPESTSSEEGNYANLDASLDSSREPVPPFEEGSSPVAVRHRKNPHSGSTSLEQSSDQHPTGDALVTGEKERDYLLALNQSNDQPGSPSCAGFLYNGQRKKSDLKDHQTHGFHVEANGHGLLKNMKLVDLWLMWFICFCAWGSMTMINTNTAEIAYAVYLGSYPNNVSSTSVPSANDTDHQFSTTVSPNVMNQVTSSRVVIYVSVFGIASALGRILVGYIHPIMNRREIPVWYLLPITSLLMAGSLVLFLVMPFVALSLPFFLVGMAAGVSWASMVLIMKRLFVHIGRHSNFLYTAGMLTPCFSLGIFSVLFAVESKKQHQSDTTICSGYGCISNSIIIATALNVGAAALGVLFCRRVNRGSLLAWDGVEGYNPCCGQPLITSAVDVNGDSPQ